MITAQQILAADTAWGNLSPREREEWGSSDYGWQALDADEAKFLAAYLNGRVKMVTTKWTRA